MTGRLDMRNALSEVAYRQAGYFTASQASAVGFSPQSQKYHADRGTWIRVERGLYRLAKWPSSEFDTFTRWFVWGETRGVISHDSAATVHGLGDLDPRRVHLTFPSGRRTRHTGVLLHTGDLPSADVVDHDTFRTTTPTRTVLDLAGARITQEQFTEAASDALGRELTDMNTLSARADDFGAEAALRIERALSSYRRDHR